LLCVYAGANWSNFPEKKIPLETRGENMRVVQPAYGWVGARQNRFGLKQTCWATHQLASETTQLMPRTFYYN